MLLGKDNFVSEVFLTKNIKKSTKIFEISPEQTFEAYKIADSKDIEVIGIFHSHPNSEAYPSSMDKKFMYNNNPMTWIIYSCINKNFRAYILESDIKEITIQEK